LFRACGPASDGYRPPRGFGVRAPKQDSISCGGARNRSN
jgi:hypothetical protein